MRDDVRGEFSLGEFAQSVNLSMWRLCHIFKSDVGMPPIKFLRLLRMERAKDLLESSFLSVKEIAHRVGLNDESHFVRDFKSTYGFSPALYRSRFNSNRENGSHNGGSQNGGSHNGGSHNGGPPPNGGSHNNEHESTLRRQLARGIKQSILPTLQLFFYMISFVWNGGV